MRETVTTVTMRCDVCKEPAIGTYTVGVAIGEEAPTLHVIDLCEQHAQRVHSLAESIENLPTFGARAVVPSTTTRRRSKRHRCRICSNEFHTRANLTNHVWMLHTGRPPEPTPTTCPECHLRFNTGREMALHRKTHGYDALETAYTAALTGRKNDA